MRRLREAVFEGRSKRKEIMPNDWLAPLWDQDEDGVWRRLQVGGSLIFQQRRKPRKETNA
jgi:hypothetical protein